MESGWRSTSDVLRVESPKCGSTTCSERHRRALRSKGTAARRLGHRTASDWCSTATRRARRTSMSSAQMAAASPSGSPRANTHRFLHRGMPRLGWSRSCSDRRSRRQASGYCRSTAGRRRRSCSWSLASSSRMPSSLQTDAGWRTSPTSRAAARSTCNRIQGLGTESDSRPIRPVEERNLSGHRADARCCIAALAPKRACSRSRSVRCRRFASIRHSASSR